MSETLIQQYGLFLIGAGLLLVLFLLIFLVIRRQSAKKRTLRPAAQQVAEALFVEGQQGLQEPMLSQSLSAAPVPQEPKAKGQEAGGFQLFKRRKKAKAEPAGGADSGQNITRLADIEQEMLAIRELFRQGQISRSVYVAETKALYETARMMKQ
ncbi:MAG: hypothetical protein ACON49_02095 [Candidatus Puniceispirillaceae bacterium]